MSEVSNQRMQLVESGWTRRTVTDEPRMSELAELYRELGFEVKILPVAPEDLDHCTKCLEEDWARFKTIFTRRASERG
jgi:hypothetical protein